MINDVLCNSSDGVIIKISKVSCLNSYSDLTEQRVHDACANDLHYHGGCPGAMYATVM